jgi:hypothetical protein
LKVSPEFDDARVEELFSLLLAQEKEFWVVTRESKMLIIRGSPPFELVDLIAETFGLV